MIMLILIFSMEDTWKFEKGRCLKEKDQKLLWIFLACQKKLAEVVHTSLWAFVFNLKKLPNAKRMIIMFIFMTLGCFFMLTKVDLINMCSSWWVTKMSRTAEFTRRFVGLLKPFLPLSKYTFSYSSFFRF